MADRSSHGNPLDNDIPTAPKGVIGDDGDLRTMRDALRAGKSVTLAPDGKVYVSGEPTHPPMTEAQENLIESHMGEVVAMAQGGFGVSLDPSGRISADRADHNVKILFNADPDIDTEQHNLIRQGIADGAAVTIRSDGMVIYNKGTDAVPPSGDVARNLNQIVDEQIANGGLRAALDSGQGMSIHPEHNDAIYSTLGVSPTGIPFPEDADIQQPGQQGQQGQQPGDDLPLPVPPPGADDGGDAHTAPTTPADPTAGDPTLADPTSADPTSADPSESSGPAPATAAAVTSATLMQRALDLEAAAKSDRTQRLEDWTNQSESINTDRNQAIRDQAAANAIATAADDQVTAAKASLDKFAADRATYVAQSPGDEEAQEKVLSMDAAIASAQVRVDEAQQAADAARADAETHGQHVAELDTALTDLRTSDRASETATDDAEERALVLRVASEQLQEAERLESAADDMEQEGNAEGAAKVRAAAAEQRAGSEHTQWEAEQLAPPSPTDPAEPSAGATSPTDDGFPTEPGTGIPDSAAPKNPAGHLYDDVDQSMNDTTNDLTGDREATVLVAAGAVAAGHADVDPITGESVDATVDIADNDSSPETSPADTSSDDTSRSDTSTGDVAVSDTQSLADPFDNEIDDGDAAGRLAALPFPAPSIDTESSARPDQATETSLGSGSDGATSDTTWAAPIVDTTSNDTASNDPTSGEASADDSVSAASATDAEFDTIADSTDWSSSVGLDAADLSGADAADTASDAVGTAEATSYAAGFDASLGDPASDTGSTDTVGDAPADQTGIDGQDSYDTFADPAVDGSTQPTVFAAAETAYDSDMSQPDVSQTETTTGDAATADDTTTDDTTTDDTTSYDTTSYDTTSYDTTSYDTTSYDTTSYDQPADSSTEDSAYDA